MQVHALCAADQKLSGPLRQYAATLIELSGTPQFEATLFRAARETARCEHLTAFAFSDTTEPRVVMAMNTGDLPVAHHVAEKYMLRYWMLDPANRLGSNEFRQSTELAVSIRSDEIDDSGYRRECYTNVGLQDRISLVSPQNGEMFRVNFYKAPKSGRFAPEEMSHIFEAADLIMSLLAKHDAMAMPTHGPAAARVFQRRLKLLGKRLPKREIEVCSLIARGISSEGIALELGVSLNTILTHRKRAYARLGISSQNELLRLLLS